MCAARPRFWIAVALSALAACSHVSRPAKPGPAVTSKNGASAPSQPQTTGGATAAFPSPSSTAQKPSGALLPAAPKKIPRVPPNAAPQILNVAVSETTVQPGDRVYGRVVTTSNVASVEARIGGYAVSLRKVGVGRFELTYTVGPLPWFIRGNFTMQVIAHNTRGDTTTRAIPLTVR